MIKIAICDDEEKNLDILTDLLKEYCQGKSVSFVVHKYITGIKLLDELERGTKYDVMFLDIEMDSINGILLAERIRKYDMKVPIIYVTNYEDYWRKAYKVHAFQFLVKPLKKSELFKTIDDFMKAYSELKELKVQLKCENGTVIVPQSDIDYFFIMQKKTVHMETSSGSYIVKENLKDIFDKLKADDFYMSHKSCIINLRHVKSLENNYDIIMTNGEFMPLAQNRKTEFMSRLTNRYVKIIEGGII